MDTSTPVRGLPAVSFTKPRTTAACVSWIVPLETPVCTGSEPVYRKDVDSSKDGAPSFDGRAGACGTAGSAGTETPFAESVTLAVPPGSALTWMLPAAAPSVAGLNASPREQEAPPSSWVPVHSSDSTRNPAPLIATASAAVGSAPSFVTVTFFTLDVSPTSTLPNSALVGSIRSVPGAEPDPVSAAVAVPPGAPWKTSCPVAAPSLIGAKTTPTVQELRGPRRTLAQPSVVIVNAAPSTSVSIAPVVWPPSFVTTNSVSGDDVPVATAPKSVESGLTATCAGAAPVPLNAAPTSPPGDAERDSPPAPGPAVVGVKITLTVHEAPAPSAPPAQVSTCTAKSPVIAVATTPVG